MKRLSIALVFLVLLALVPIPAQAEECGWYTGRVMAEYWCYTPQAGWWVEYSPGQDIATYRQYGYDAYDGDGVYHLPNGSQPLSQWDDVCGFGLRCSDITR